ncbi:MAG TPA: hypothetical protein VMT00_10490 [Thermoanaerobaculia bacterium]|nr:hypothetical protein [Thermoanaerobaculia bacterium]
MRSSRFILALALFGAFSTQPVRGQHEHHAHEHAKPEKLGKVDFPTSCNAAAQERFIRGVALLHSFWYPEAARTFQSAAEADPQCGMAWWGVAMSYYHPLWAPPNSEELKAGSEAAAKAKSIGAKTARERDYVAAINAFYRDHDKVEHPQRARALEQALERMTRAYPQDQEAKVFYALALNSTASPTDKTYANQKKGAEILNRFFESSPDHPGVAHYIIHSYDYPALAHLALPAARVYAKIAPSSAHALHMPSHIFVRLGLWDETVASNIDSANAGRASLKEQKSGHFSWDELHAMDYMAYAWLQRGEDAKAKDLLEKVSRYESADVPNFAVGYAVAAIPARYALERRDWATAAKLEVGPPAIAWSKFSYAEALTHFARGMGGARSGDLETARAAVARLDAIRGELESQKNTYWAGQVEIQRLAAAGWLARAEGKDKEAVSLLRQAADLEDSTDKHPVTPGSLLPAREMLADLLLELGKPAKALVEYETSLTSAANRFNSLSGAARAAQLSGDREKAMKYYAGVAKLVNGEGTAAVASR